MTPGLYPPRIITPRVRFWSCDSERTRTVLVAEWSMTLAWREGKTVQEAEDELWRKLAYVYGGGKCAFEVWGPQELADRINEAQDAWVVEKNLQKTFGADAP